MRSALLLAFGGMLLGGLSGPVVAQTDKVSFDMTVSAGAASCLPDARAHVTVRSSGANERMQVRVAGLPPNTSFTFFVLQVPTGPFGMSWYQGDIDTDATGSGSQQFFGVFSSETFMFAPASRPAPQTDPGTDALTNPVTAPVHMYHLGMWFADATDAGNAGCPAGGTPFDGDHAAGIQVLNTSNFGLNAEDGPLGQLK
jgi:hypothetical protein